MPDYVEEIEMKEIGIISLKVKIKESEVILFDDDVEEDSEYPEDEEIKKEAEKLYQNELVKLQKKYGDNIPEAELKKARKLIDSMNFYWQTQSSFNDDLFAKLQTSMSGLEGKTENSNDNELFDKIFKVMLFQYAKSKQNLQKSEESYKKIEKDLKESNEFLEKSRTKVRYYENLGTFDHLKLFFKRLSGK